MVTPNGATTSYQYNGLGELLSETSPDRGTTTFTYDSAGLVATRTDARGIKATFHYDALNRLTAVLYPTQRTKRRGWEGFWRHDRDDKRSPDDVQLTYDSGRDCGLGVGRLCTVRTDADVMRFRYDAFGQATRQTDTIDGVSYVTAYAYNTLNRLTRMTYPDGRTVTYRRDALDRIAGIDTTVNGRAATVLSGITYRLDGLLAVAVHLKLTRGIPGMAVSIPAFRQSGRHGPGMVAAMVPEWWPPWSRNGGRHGPGMVAALGRNAQMQRQWSKIYCSATT